MRGALLIFAACAIAACTSSARVPGPTGGGNDVPANYPTTVIESAEHRDSTRREWERLLASYNLPPERAKAPELNAFTHTPSSTLGSGPIPLVAAGTTTPTDEESLRLLLREFVTKHADLLGVTAGSLSLERVSDASAVGRRFSFIQAGFPYPIAPPAGRLEFVVSPKAEIVQINDTAIPLAEIPSEARVTREAAEKVVLGTTFTYGDIAGRPQSVTITDPNAVKATGLYVYADETDAALTVRLAWEVIAGTGTTWTVYVDAVTGQVVGKRQNFQT